MITVQIIVKNNESDLGDVLESLMPLNAEIQVISDQEVTFCKQFGINVIKTQEKNQSKIRNQLAKAAKNDWCLWLTPTEKIVQGHEFLNSLDKPKVYYCELIQNNIITKPVKLWNKKMNLLFHNPCFETLACPEAEYAPVVLWRNDHKIQNMAELQKWKQEDPMAVEPYYYEACQALLDGKHDEFMKLSDHYLFNEKNNGICTTMMTYYQGIVQCLVTSEFKEALKKAVVCLSNNVVMAEFWCLLGDIFFKTGDFEKAIAFYKNATIIGERRSRKDKWPCDISKYQEYPNKMIEYCLKP